jgi:hypothetical protein
MRHSANIPVAQSINQQLKFIIIASGTSLKQDMTLTSQHAGTTAYLVRYIHIC